MSEGKCTNCGDAFSNHSEADCISDAIAGMRAENEKLRAALKEALDIADYEASEYQGKLANLTRIAELRKEFGL